MTARLPAEWFPSNSTRKGLPRPGHRPLRDSVALSSYRLFQLQHYWIDKFEVTNPEFKRFLDQGGYERQEYWKHPKSERRRVRLWAEAINTSSTKRIDRAPPRRCKVNTRKGRTISRHRRELVRSGCLRGIRRQIPADYLSLECRRLTYRQPEPHTGQQLQWDGTARRSEHSRCELVWRVRYGRQREGVVLK